MTSFVPQAVKLIQSNLVPECWIRVGMRHILRETINRMKARDMEFAREDIIKFIQMMKASPIAVNTSDANEQHYELPTDFFQYCLGKHLKYSGGYWREGCVSLDQAEEDMLAITTERADLQNGQSILELGCGWGSLTLFMAERFPKANITAVSNSRTQKEYIDRQANERGLGNIHVITADMNEFELNQKFDRVVSVEMFEHMRNWEQLLHKVSGMCKPDAKLFVHIFTHRCFAYLYDDSDPNDFIGRYFFTGGMMPSDDLMLYFQDDFKIDHHWRVSGTHYSKTANAWWDNMRRYQAEIMPIFEKTYGVDANKWWVYWRLFYLACAELWGYDKGREWFVSHYLLRKR